MFVLLLPRLLPEGGWDLPPPTNSITLPSDLSNYYLTNLTDIYTNQISPNKHSLMNQKLKKAVGK